MKPEQFASESAAELVEGCADELGGVLGGLPCPQHLVVRQRGGCVKAVGTLDESVGDPRLFQGRGGDVDRVHALHSSSLFPGGCRGHGVAGTGGGAQCPEGVVPD